jgi:ribosome-binding protein aMBF1 (putative translation factor)
MYSSKRLRKHRTEHLKQQQRDYGKSIMNSLKDVKARILKNAEVSAEYSIQAPEFAIARELIAARVRAGMTQAELAHRMSTTQSTIARLESGRMMPSMRTISRYAQATNSHTVVRLVANKKAQPCELG